MDKCHKSQKVVSHPIHEEARQISDAHYFTRGIVDKIAHPGQYGGGSEKNSFR